MKIHWPKITKASIKRFAKAGFFVAIFSGSLPLLNYIRQDTSVSEANEVLLLTLVFILTGLIFLATYGLWLKTNAERIFASIVTTYALMEYRLEVFDAFSWLRTPLGNTKSGLIIELFLYVGVGLVAIALNKTDGFLEKKKLANKPFQTIIKFVCIATLVISIYQFGTYVDARSKVSTYQPANTVSATKLIAPGQPQPDIYYFVFDRYGNSQSLKNYFDFDNTDFLNQLRAKDFIVRDPAYSNYQFTAPSVASTLRMGYLDDIAKDLPGEQYSNFLPYKKIIDDSQTVALLRDAGYNAYNFGNWWNVTRKLKNATNVLPQFQATVLGKSFVLSELQTDVLANTFLGGILKRMPDIFGKTVLRVNNETARELYLTQLDEVSKLAAKKHSKPRFVFAHFLNAHPPYMFNADGSLPTYGQNDDDVDVPRKVKYINQLKYTNETVTKLINIIQQNSKTPPVIIIQADEGPYQLDWGGDWRQAPVDILKLKLGILAAYSLPGISSEETSKISSSVNIFRFVFNKYFGTKLDYLPDCSYVYNSTMPFTFYDVTAKLHGQENPNCK